MRKEKTITHDIFEKMALSGDWESYYDVDVNYRSYNFITRRDSVVSLIDGDHYKKILDIGCGTGDYAPFLYSDGNCYFGMDFSFSMVKHAKDRYQQSDHCVRFLSADALYLPYPSKCFDLIIAVGFIEYIKSNDKFLKELQRVIKPGGTLIVQSYQTDLFRKLIKLPGINILRRIAGKIYRKMKGIAFVQFQFHQPYSKAQLDGLLAKYGFRIIDYRYNNFIVFPRSICKAIPGIYIRISEHIDKKNPKFRRFAVNYIGKYTLEKNFVKR